MKKELVSFITALLVMAIGASAKAIQDVAVLKENKENTKEEMQRLHRSVEKLHDKFDRIIEERL